MPAGKGFGTSPMGFNKQEVNEYIASLSKRMSELETEKKEIEKKYESVKKVVDGSDEKIKQIEFASKERIDQLEAQVKAERKNSEELIDQVDELKRKLKNAGVSVNIPAGKSDGTSAARKRASEIIEDAEKTAKETVAKANKTAAEVVEKAKKTASEIMGSAGGAGKSVDLSGFMAKLREFANSVNAGCKELMDSASEISEGQSEVSFEMPDFSDFTAPSADVPETSGSDFGGDSDVSSTMDDINDLIASMSGGNADDSDMSGNMNGSMGSDEIDMGFGFTDINAGSSGAEMSLGLDTDISSEDAGEQKESAFNLDLGDDMFSGVKAETSDEMNSDLSADLADTVEADDVSISGFGQSSEMDEMQKLLEQAEATFGGGSSEFEEKTADVAEASSGDDWSSLQSELDALEKQDGSSDETPVSSGSDDKQSSDNDIWSLGDMDMSDSGDDDDMSSDIFGSF